MVNVVRHFGEGFVLGLATGHICLATCGPVYLPFIAGKARSIRSSVFTVLELSAGRFITYILIGAFAGYLGYRISDVNRQYFTMAAYVLLSGFLIISALRGHRCESGCSIGVSSRFADSPLLLGIVTGINFCPSFLIALTRSVDLAGPLAGMSFFAAFFFGTSVFLLPLLFACFLGRKKQLRTIARFAALGVAAWFFGSAAMSAYAMADQNRNVISILNETPLYVVMKDSTVGAAYASALAAKRKGPVFIIGDTAGLSTRCYAVIGPEFTRQNGDAIISMRKPNRFLIVLAADNSHETATEKARQLTLFLSHYFFKNDPRNGSVFYYRG